MQIEGFSFIPEKEPSRIENIAKTLVKILHLSFAGSAKQSLKHNKGQPWWDHNCRDAKYRYREISCMRLPTQADRKTYRKVIRQAKARFFYKKLDGASCAKDAFEISKWHKSKGHFRMPPLRDPSHPEDGLVQTLEGKRDVLIRNLLHNQSETDDIPFSTPTVASTILPFPPITYYEVSNAILSAGSTVPSIDGIPTSVLRLAWPYVSTLLLDLFLSCIGAGYHPHCFRTATLAIIEKPNKLDRSSPGSYRPIALLFVLGKGLERLIAKRRSWIAIKYKDFAQQKFGALPLRSSVSLTISLTHDVETALSTGLTASVASLDIKGASDAVFPGRLVRQLREQGWPAHLCNWVASFASERKVCNCLVNEVRPQQSIICGLPQGSPILPILFTLQISPLFKLRGWENAFRYADDIALLETSPELQENSTKLAAAINKALDWGREEGLNFDPGKSELIHFSRKRKDKETTLP